MSGLNKLDLMIYIAIIDYRLFFFFALLSLRLNFKKKLKARKVMPRAYYRFLPKRSKVIPPFSNAPNFLEISVPVSEIAFLTYLIMLLET